MSNSNIIVVRAAGARGPKGTQGVQGALGIGVQGTTGPQGIQGPAGSGGGSFNVSLVSYTYEQMTTSNVWNIVHNLNFRPNVMVMDYGQNNIECDIAYIDANSLTLTFSAAVSGYAYLS